MVCEKCGCLWRIDADDLTKQVEALLSENMGEWRRQGAVIFRCGER